MSVAALVETHAAIVFFVGDHAYRLKKPVNLGFLDFRERADREVVCHREVEPNLGWKLAFAARAARPDWLLDTYDAERRPAAHRALRQTNLIFRAESSTDAVTAFARGAILPLAVPFVPAVLRGRRLIAGALQLLGQLSLNCRIG